jgi:hypothetical protein
MILFSAPGNVTSFDLPPLKWSSLRYDFAMKEDDNGEEETHSGRDHLEVAAG